MTSIAPDDPNDVAVNLTGLADFAKRLQAEADHLKQETLAMAREYNKGVTIGVGMPTMGMAKMSNQYRAALKRIVEQLNHFWMAGAILAEAAETISKRYNNADDLAQLSLNDVKSALATASVDVKDPLTIPNQVDQPILINGQWAS